MPARGQRRGTATSAALGIPPNNRPASQRDALEGDARGLHAPSVIVPNPGPHRPACRISASRWDVGTPTCPRAARYPGLRSTALPSHWPRAGIGRRASGGGEHATYDWRQSGTDQFAGLRITRELERGSICPIANLGPPLARRPMPGGGPAQRRSHKRSPGYPHPTIAQRPNGTR